MHEWMFGDTATVVLQLRLDVSAQGGGRVLATLADNDLQVLRMLIASILHIKDLPFALQLPHLSSFLTPSYGAAAAGSSYYQPCCYCGIF